MGHNFHAIDEKIFFAFEYILDRKILIEMYFTLIAAGAGVMLKLDLHVHSCYSEDGTGTPKEIIQTLKKKGFQGMALTDHNTLAGSLEAMKHASKDFLIIPGLEISSKDGHILALNVRKVVSRGLSTEETIDEILNLGGTPIIPHLYRNLSGIHLENLENVKQKIHAIEVFNSCSTPKTNVHTAQIARQYMLGGTGGSDSHTPAYAGYGYTTVDSTSLTCDDIIAAIEKKQTWGEGRIMPLSYRQDRMQKSIIQFFQRGLRRI